MRCIVPLTAIFASLSALCAQSEPELVLTYRVAETRGTENPVTSSDTLRVRLARDAFDIVRGDVFVHHDMANLQLYVLDLEKKTCIPHRALATLDFRLAEQKSRERLAQVLEAADVEKEPLGNKLEMEALFGVGDVAAARIAIERGEDRALAFEVAGESLASCAFDSAEVPAELRRSFSQFLFFACKLHQKTRHAIASEGRIPTSLRYRVVDTGNVRRFDWTLIEDESPMPRFERNDFAMVRSDDARLAEILGAGHALLEGGRLRKSREALFSKIEERAAAGETVDAFVLFLELSWMRGKTDRAAIRRVMAGEGARARVQPLSQAFEGPPKAMLAYLDTVPRDSLTHPYVLDVLRANAHAAMRQLPEATELLLSALEANPGMAGVWKDLGDSYRAVYDMPSAWNCWQLGLRLDPEHPMFSDVVRLEENLRVRFEGLF